jgi:hypothetical protein
MNLNYSNLNIDNIEQTVRDKYSFPEDKEFLRKYIRGESIMTREEVVNLNNSVNKDILIIVSGLTVGTFSYFFLLMPAGKVIRDKIDAQRSVPHRFFRRALPFLGLAVPLLILRKKFDYTNGYKN